MKKILISAYSLNIGGIETALITLLKNISNKCDITLVLEKKEGIFLQEIPKNIKIITYKPSNNKIVPLRKLINFVKQQRFKMKYNNKYDFSASYATYSFPCSFVARVASKNSCLWVHNDFLNFYNNDEEKYKKFFENLKVQDFKKIVFVSENDKNVFTKIFIQYENKCIKCNNLIDYKKIIEKSNENIIDFDKDDNLTTFINIGRHDEKQKKLSRIINACKKLNKDGYKFQILFVGDGHDSLKYKEMAKDTPNIKFLGAKANPYPYLKKSDYMVMSSDFEGYPVVFIEAMILGKPIITTDVSDSMKDVNDKYGIVVEKTEDDIYNAMKVFLEDGFKIQEFNPKKYNEEILKKIDEIFT